LLAGGGRGGRKTIGVANLGSRHGAVALQRLSRLGRKKKAAGGGGRGALPVGGVRRMGLLF